MSLAIAYSRAQIGVETPLVTVEVHLSNGLPSLSIVGLPEAAVKESKDRVRGALLNSNFEFPARRITINLAPADLPKEGGRFDLPIALGILAASGQIPAEALCRYEFLGELALGGELRFIRGVLPAAIQTREAKRKLVIPQQNGAEATLVDGAEIFAPGHLLDICAHLNGIQKLEPVRRNGAFVHAAKEPNEDKEIEAKMAEDLADVRGQFHAKRALEVAAAGGHSLLLIGPPGTGKTMLASRLPGILPQLNEIEALETAAVASISDHGFEISRWRKRPFRAPHHTASGVALVGGGSTPRPGEISLADHGVLFRTNPENRGEESALVRKRVELARERQASRAGCANATMKNNEVEKYCRVNDNDSKLLERAIDQLGLSARAYHRILKVARTIADLSNEPHIQTQHLTEAIGYRRLDRTLV